MKVTGGQTGQNLQRDVLQNGAKRGDQSSDTMYQFCNKDIKKNRTTPTPFFTGSPPLFMKNLKSHLFAAFSRPYQPFK